MGFIRPIGPIGVGTLRFKDRQEAIKIVRRAIDFGFNYIDTAPDYRYQSEEENAEGWVGEALSLGDYRQRVMLGAKCRPLEDSASVLRQSLKRLGQPYVDFYNMWAVHDLETFSKSAPWFERVQQYSHQWGSLGITSHADAVTIMEFLATGFFKAVTVPLNVINRSRLQVVDYCREHGIQVFAMNPFSGGMLAKEPKLRELSLTYLLKLEGVCALIGFSTLGEVEEVWRIATEVESCTLTPEQIALEVERLTRVPPRHCTSCGYCAPCPEGISLGECLSSFNMVCYFGSAEAKRDFLWRQWDPRFQLDRCQECLTCLSRCPNGLPLDEIIPEAKKVLYP